MTADAEAPAVAEDRRSIILAAGINALWELEPGGDEVRPEDAAPFIELLDRFDEKEGVVRVNLIKQRAIEAERDRLRGVVHAMLQAFEQGETTVDGQSGKAYVRSIWVPESMFAGWRLAAEGGR